MIIWCARLLRYSFFAIIFDINGREVAQPVNENLQPGLYEFKFKAIDLPSGVYFYNLKTEEFTETKSMMLIK